MVPWARPWERTFSGKFLQIFLIHHYNYIDVWGNNCSATASSNTSTSTVDARAKASLKGYLTKLKEAKEDLEHIHKVNEEERERMSARR